MSIIIRGLRKAYNGDVLFKGLSIRAQKGRITAVFGPNGCGKTTLFNILSGIARQDGGDYDIRGFDRFRFSYMFQDYRESLLPWRNNFDNIALPLQIQDISKEGISERIKALMGSFDFRLDLDGYPYELSGGQQQFLAFLRSLVTSPNILLLDEPFSALDYENSIRLRNSLQAYHMSEGSTIFIITHDIEEAVYLASDIIVLSRRPTRVLGRIKNPIPYPRTSETLQSREFHDVKNKVLQLFHSEVGL